MPTNFVELAILTPLPGQSLHSPSFIISLQRILNTLSSTPGALKFRFRISISKTPQLLFLALWTDKSGHEYLDIHGLAPKLMKEMFVLVKPDMVHYMYLDFSNIDLEAENVSVDIFYVKEGKRREFEEVVKSTRRVGGWYVARGLPEAPLVMPTDEKELRIVRMQKERAEKAIGEKVPDVWVGISTWNEGGEGFREQTRELVDRCESGVWGKYLEGGKDAPLGGIDLK
ncbi:hypothetical protein ONS95_011006 [Cadophora gregata]|uniref:uncharacterized protein n=1 Tax=Cadophora gregata TaxID=51156 RepID=UPI0026DBA3D9|nr:uncharacterized protein ONS95_011006 [Cadophora gregata]KAK0119566.1 hypothetical protein ONS95_011006 [Cadophora gregata]KAK0120602.1 hypothetical protein ONS96_010806 [Cadophora gregata f. sp. sojae]